MATVRFLTIYNAATPDYGVEVGLTWFVPGILLAAAYFFYTYRSFSGKDPPLIRKLLRMAEIENVRRCSDRVPKPSR